MPFLFHEDGRQWRGKIDLVYRWDGELYVADFKTDRIGEGPEPGPAALAAQAAAHSAQVAVYGRALAGALALPRAPVAEIWLLRYGRRVACHGGAQGDGPPPAQGPPLP